MHRLAGGVQTRHQNRPRIRINVLLREINKGLDMRQ